ncbi:hypothetical protein Tco_1266225 [Tanacetum coccineum]
MIYSTVQPEAGVMEPLIKTDPATPEPAWTIHHPGLSIAQKQLGPLLEVESSCASTGELSTCLTRGYGAMRMVGRTGLVRNPQKMKAAYYPDVGLEQLCMVSLIGGFKDNEYMFHDPARSGRDLPRQDNPLVSVDKVLRYDYIKASNVGTKGNKNMQVVEIFLNGYNQMIGILITGNPCKEILLKIGIYLITRDEDSQRFGDGNGDHLIQCESIPPPIMLTLESNDALTRDDKSLRFESDLKESSKMHKLWKSLIVLYILYKDHSKIEEVKDFSYRR